MAKFKKQCTSGDKASRYILLLNVTVGSGNVTTNKTPVSYTLQLAGGNYDGDNYNQYGSSFYGYTCNGSVTVKNKSTGATLKTSSGSSKGTVSNTSAITIASGSFDAPHNDDGTLTLSFSGTFSGGLSTQATGGSVSGDVTLTTIARASAITATNADIESATTINIDKKSSSFTTTITYAFGDLTGTIVDKTSNTSVSWTVPSTFYAQIPNAKYGTCTLTATTYSGTTKVGSKTTTFKATADEEKCRPTATITAVDSNETTKSLTDGIGNVVVIGKSNVLCTVTRSAKNSATIKSVKVNGTELGTSTTQVTFNNANTNVFEVVVTDSRGYTNEEKIATLGKVDYIDVSIDAKVERNTPTDGKVNITFNGKYFNGSFGKADNALAVQYIYKEKGTSEYSDPIALTVTLKDNTFSGEALEVEGFDYEKEYVFQVTATDRLSSAPKTVVEIPINKGKPVYWWDEDSFNVLVDMYLNKNAYLGDLNLNNFFNKVPQNIVKYTSSGSSTTKYNRIAKITLKDSYERCYLNGQIVEFEHYHSLFDVTLAFRLNQDGITIVAGNTKLVKREIIPSSEIEPYVYVTQNDENGTVIELWTVTKGAWRTPSFKMINEVNSNSNKHWDLTPLSSNSEPSYVQKMSFNSDKNIMSIGLSAHTDFALSSAYSYVNVTLNTLKNSIGNKLTFSGNKIVIGDGVSKVLVSACALTKGIAGSQIINIVKGTTAVESGYHVETATGSWGTIGLTPLLLDVSKGDTIGLQCGASVAGTITVGGTGFTTLTVEVVE